MQKYFFTRVNKIAFETIVVDTAQLNKRYHISYQLNNKL